MNVKILFKMQTRERLIRKVHCLQHEALKRWTLKPPGCFCSRCFGASHRPDAVTAGKMAGIKKRREEAGLQHYTKSSLLYFYFCLFTFQMMAIGHLIFFVQQKNRFKWLKPPQKCKHVKTNSGFQCFAFLSVRFWARSSWHKGGAGPIQRLPPPGISSAVSVQEGVRVRCGWVGARGWTAGCSPPSPWWSWEERTACWGTRRRRGGAKSKRRHI